MLTPLNRHDLARLHAKFVVPIVVDRMLHDEETLDDIAEHAMNELLAELCPDTALLCIALCARHVAKTVPDLPAGGTLALAADKIADEYGALWLAHERDPDSLADSAVEQTLAHIPEDLETMRDLLDALMADLEEDHCVAAILCDILSAQADYHKDLALVELAQINLRPAPRPAEDSAPAPAATAEDTDNVIVFPGAVTTLRPPAGR